MQHEDFMNQTLLNAEGFLFVIDSRHPKFPHAICATQGVNPEYINLLAGSLLLYRTAQEAVTYMEHLIEYLEEKGLGEAVPTVAAIQATLHSALKIARDGMKKSSEG